MPNRVWQWVAADCLEWLGWAVMEAESILSGAVPFSESGPSGLERGRAAVTLFATFV
ncbi:MAG: hypothetical protein OSA45_16845 [Halioglobus sp.]|nr:hypothetical protein [Halioglobus sp.]